jgi:hypothetical protein
MIGAILCMVDKKVEKIRSKRAARQGRGAVSDDSSWRASSIVPRGRGVKIIVERRLRSATAKATTFL